MKLFRAGYYPDNADMEEVKNSEVTLAKKAIADLGWEKRKTINKGVNSYSLKHVCERYLRTVMDAEVECYIGNGSLIQAMNDLDYKSRIKQPNAFFNVRVDNGK